MEKERLVLEFCGDGYSIRYGSRRLYPLANPKATVARKARLLTLQRNTLYLVPSPLLFYGMDVLLKTAPRDVLFLCVERDQTLMDLSLRKGDLSCINDRRMLYLRTADVSAVLSALSEASVWRYRRVRMISLNGGYGLHRDFYDELLEAVEEYGRTQWQNRLTRVHMSRLWLRNLFRNIGSS